MREYKFRGQRKDNGEWVYGSLLQSEIDVNQLNVKCQIHERFAHDFSISVHDVKPETVGQWIGYNDLYEGDIVQSANGKQWVIVWRDFGWWIDNADIKDNGRNKLAGIEFYRLAYYISLAEQAGAKFVLEKVSNIHTHPHLLQNKVV